jgi:hypothetical protein
VDGGSIGRSSELPWGLGALYGPLTRKTRGWSEPPPCSRKIEDSGSFAVAVLTKMAAGGGCIDIR